MCTIKKKQNNDLPFALGVDTDGNYGYIKDGADTVTPFKGAYNKVIFGFYYASLNSGNWCIYVITVYDAKNNQFGTITAGYGSIGSPTYSSNFIKDYATLTLLGYYHNYKITFNYDTTWYNYKGEIIRTVKAGKSYQSSTFYGNEYTYAIMDI